MNNAHSDCIPMNAACLNGKTVTAFLGVQDYLWLCHCFCDPPVHGAALQCHRQLWLRCFGRRLPPASGFIFTVKFQEFRQLL